MDFYHGSIVGGLTELIPFAKGSSNLKEAAVYLTASKQLAIIAHLGHQCLRFVKMEY